MCSSSSSIRSSSIRSSSIRSSVIKTTILNGGGQVTTVYDKWRQDDILVICYIFQ